MDFQLVPLPLSRFWSRSLFYPSELLSKQSFWQSSFKPLSRYKLKRFNLMIILRQPKDNYQIRLQ